MPSIRSKLQIYQQKAKENKTWSIKYLSKNKNWKKSYKWMTFNLVLYLYDFFKKNRLIF